MTKNQYQTSIKKLVERYSLHLTALLFAAITSIIIGLLLSVLFHGKYTANAPSNGTHSYEQCTCNSHCSNVEMLKFKEFSANNCA